MLSRYRVAPLAAALLAASGFAADESVGLPLPAPALEALRVTAATITISGGQVTTDMQVKPAGRTSRIDWRMPPFKWVSMDADERDPAFSELRAFADGVPIDIHRSAAAWLGGTDISPELRAERIDIANISLGNIDELPTAGSAGLPEGDQARAYFRDVDGTLFPAWETHIHAWAEVPSVTRRLSYTYRLRPGFFLVAGQPDAAAKRIEATCKLKPDMREALRASLAQGNLVCLYRVPIPNIGVAKSVQWRSHGEESDGYICSAASEVTSRKISGAAVLSGTNLAEVRAVTITKEDHCEL